MVKKADRPEDGPACPRCQTTNRPARSFCRKCGLHLRPQSLPRATVERGRTRTPRRARPPRPVSDRRADEREQRAAVVAEVRRRDRTCRAGALVALVQIPHGGRLDVHEIIPRSAWAGGYLVVGNCLLVCRDHHRWVDMHPRAAHVLGLHGFSWERPDLDPGARPVQALTGDYGALHRL